MRNKQPSKQECAMHIEWSSFFPSPFSENKKRIDFYLIPSMEGEIFKRSISK